MNEQDLIAAALAVRGNAYAPYSRFSVGCALLTANGTLYTGCNVENSSLGLSICAERNAIAAMVADNQRDIETIVVAASPLASPCGACRQFIVEFGSEIDVICCNAEDPQALHRWKIADLIPNYFQLGKSTL